MLPDTFFQVMSVTTDLVIFLFVGYYVLRLRSREEEIEKKEKKIDTNYHEIVDDALTKERRILEDATAEADKIIADTQLISDSSKESMSLALEGMKTDIHTEVGSLANSYHSQYQTALQKLTNESLDDFKNVSKELQENLRKEVTTFQSSLLPNLQKELDAYKQSRMKETDQIVTKVVQKVSQQVLNKTLSMEDHQKLLLDALEKAKQEGIFD